MSLEIDITWVVSYNYAINDFNCHILVSKHDNYQSHGKILGAYPPPPSQLGSGVLLLRKLMHYPSKLVRMLLHIQLITLRQMVLNTPKYHPLLKKKKHKW
jgi:hypothetical protein